MPYSTIEVAARGRTRLAADTLFGKFTDVSGAYRFGPPGHDVVIAELREAGHDTICSSDLLLPHGMPAQSVTRPGLSGRVLQSTANESLLEVESERLAYGVHIESRGWMALDNYFHIAPGGKVSVRLCGPADERPATVHVRSLNGGSCLVRMAQVPSAVTSG